MMILNAAVVVLTLAGPFLLPFVADGLLFSSASVRSRTQTVKNDLSPEWDETFEFAVKDFTRILEVEVFDADVVVDESMGAFTVRLEDLLHKRRVGDFGFLSVLSFPPACCFVPAGSIVCV